MEMYVPVYCNRIPVFVRHWSDYYDGKPSVILSTCAVYVHGALYSYFASQHHLLLVAGRIPIPRLLLVLPYTAPSLT